METNVSGHPSRRALILGSAGAAGLAAAGGGLAQPSAAAGEPYADYGDSGYVVSHYSIVTTIMTGGQLHLSGTTTMQCRSTRALKQLFVSFQHAPSWVTINGRAASWSSLSLSADSPGHPGHRRFAVSGFSIGSGDTFELRVGYSCSPTENRTGGLVASGSFFVVAGQPIAATEWFPCNDRLDVKSTYDVSVTTQRSNQVLLHNPTSRSSSVVGRTPTTTVTFRVVEPSTTYQLGLAIGPFSMTQGTWSVGGKAVPFHVAVQPGFSASTILAHTPRALNFYASLYGAFPFGHAGGVLVKQTAVGAQETIGGPTYDSGCNTGAFVAHENAHMWFGNSVSASHWSDVILVHEGLATLLEWDYVQMRRATAGERLGMWAYPSSTPSGTALPASMDVTAAVYSNASGLMRELRRAMDGSIDLHPDGRFTVLLRGLARDFSHSSITRAQFKAEAERAHGASLAGFWRRYGL